MKIAIICINNKYFNHIVICKMRKDNEINRAGHRFGFKDKRMFQSARKCRLNTYKQVLKPNESFLRMVQCDLRKRCSFFKRRDATSGLLVAPNPLCPFKSKVPNFSKNQHLQ